MVQNAETLSDKVALVTGAAHRLGARIARCLHAQGMDMVLHYRGSEAAAQALAAELTLSRPDSVLLLRADLNRCHEFTGLIERIRAFRGRLDVLVNNASGFYPTPFDDAGEEQWEELMGSNLKGPFFLTKAAAPLLRAASGCVVNLVDIHAERPLEGYPIYSIAKAGNAMMVKALAWELGPQVRVNGIAPGAILWPEQMSGGRQTRDTRAHGTQACRCAHGYRPGPDIFDSRCRLHHRPDYRRRRRQDAPAINQNSKAIGRRGGADFSKARQSSP